MNTVRECKQAIVRCANACENALSMAHAFGHDDPAIDAYWRHVAADWSRFAFSLAWHLPTTSPTRQPKGHAP